MPEIKQKSLYRQHTNLNKPKIKTSKNYDGKSVIIPLDPKLKSETISANHRSSNNSPRNQDIATERLRYQYRKTSLDPKLTYTDKKLVKHRPMMHAIDDHPNGSGRLYSI